MPTIVETPSRGRAARFQGPQGSEHDTAAVESYEPAGGEVGPVGVDGRGSHGVQSFEMLEDPSFWKDHNVQVIIRVRPLNSTEVSLQGNNRCVRQDSCQSITWTGHPESRFTFDLVADEYVSQEKLFKVAGVPMVDNCVSGYNSCMFAYGQTGSGKTHTMLGDIEGGTRRHSVNCGMTPRVFEYLFSKIQKEKEARREEKLQFTCKCSFLEIYNEQILDLLDPSSVNLQIREDLKKGVYVENLTEFEVTSARDVLQQLLEGAANRKVASTNMNRASSRSHSVFTCVIESKWESQGITHHRFSRLNLVDLAGSERQKSSGAEGERLKEATNINKSLSTLGLVIMNLVGISNKKALHVPYRDSKLTFLLQVYIFVELGLPWGNSKTIIIANISPSNCCAFETLSTLKFAQRAKFIRNNAIVNEEASGDVLTMRLQIQQLKKEVSRLRSLMHGSGGAENPENDDVSVPGSPGSFKWEGIQGLFSPLAIDKRNSQRKDYEAALAAAFRREMDKDKSLKALNAEKEAAEQLANQRIDEVKGLKMRLRFREEGIKRLQAVASGKLSVESHLLQENEELLKEIEVLRNQVDRNPEITRFAMENLRLKEELRRLQSYVAEGEREMMSEQISDLQEKLLEALDWKFMHKKDLGFRSEYELSQSWDSSSMSAENEFLRLQAIENDREAETLRRNLNVCLEANEKLVRHVDELTLELEEARRDPHRHHVVSSGEGEIDGQMELKAMVDAIAAASQREAEAHETAILLAKENEELRAKLNVLIEENNKLIELYEAAVSEGIISKKAGEEEEDQESRKEELREVHEENERLMGLYERAMQERDELKRLREEEGEKKKKKKEEDDELQGKVEMAVGELAEAVARFGELGELAEEIHGSEEDLQLRREEISSLRSFCNEMQQRKRTMMEEKMERKRLQVQDLAPEMEIWLQREDQARKKVELQVKLAAEKEEAAAACREAAKSEARLRAELNSLKAAYREAEEQRKESKKVLFAVDNNVLAELGSAAGPPAPVKKACELLKAEEELPKLAAEMKRVRERIAAAQRMKGAEEAAAAARAAAVAEEDELREVRREREAARQTAAELTGEFWAAAVDYQESCFVAAAAEEELEMREEELLLRVEALEELRKGRICGAQKLISLLEHCRALLLSLAVSPSLSPSPSPSLSLPLSLSLFAV
ncbi:unnamed protein product [Spirodela intermedia]|uniref:Kinesin motor domain-containing protein n=1 Tax=Spirodela intermedia TaxID=51605 RepID=A0A7I8J065_SPIIN|nr:unnamed protein product [Spirodela intermedia]CAA6662821.1 unnamed protein product [Spirodela intermedia]